MSPTHHLCWIRRVPVFTMGLAGVGVFFVISGFVMFVLTEQPGVTPAKFWTARFLRIAPLYYLYTLVFLYTLIFLVLIFAAGLWPADFSPVEIVKSFLSPQPILPATIKGAFVLFVGRIEPRKNLPLLLDALDRLGRPGLRLVVVGKADFGAQAAPARLGGRNDGEYLQDVDAESLASLYHNAAMLVFPNEGEGFGIPVLEALARGAPVVCSNVTASPEDAGQFARFFGPHAEDAPGALAEAIASVLDRPPRHDASALAAHLSRFTWRRADEATVEAVTGGGQSRL